MKECPLWSIFMGTKAGAQLCIGEKCGMYKLCNPDSVVVTDETKKESKKLRVFGGGFIEEGKD